MLQLDFGDHRPLYEQIKDKIKTLIFGGALASGQQLPSVRDMATELAINPNTIQKAYKDLEAEGFIHAVLGKGNFVSPNNYTKTPEKTNKLLKSLEGFVLEMKYHDVPEDAIINIVKKIYNDGRQSI